MNALFDAAFALVVLAFGYQATTLSLWFGHWFSHLHWSPFHGFHVLGHHATYASSRSSLSRRYRYRHGAGNSFYSLVPWLVLEQIAAFAVLPRGWFLAVLAEAALVAALANHLHTQFHLRGSGLRRFAWFRRARAAHLIHHDQERNFMVADHFWDRAFGTYTGERPGAITVDDRK